MLLTYNYVAMYVLLPLFAIARSWPHLQFNFMHDSEQEAIELAHAVANS